MASRQQQLFNPVCDQLCRLFCVLACVQARSYCQSLRYQPENPNLIYAFQYLYILQSINRQTMSIFNRLLDKHEKEKLPGDLHEEQSPPKSHDFFFCLSIKKYFQVDESQIKSRMLSAIVMKPAFREVVNEHPDLYGPFWIATTLIVLIIASSSLIAFLHGQIDNQGKIQKIEYNFDQIPVASALIYGICFGAPYVIAVMTKIFGATVSVVELICVYGYSLSIFLPITAVLFVNWSIIQMILLTVAYGISTVFLIRGILSMDRKMGDRQRMALGVFIMGVQLILILMYKFYFFTLY